MDQTQGTTIFSNLRRIYITSKISVWASESKLGRNQNKWIDVFVFTLIRVRVGDFCLGPCPSLSLHVAISSDADVRGYETCMLKAACSHGRYQIWSKMTVDSDDLGCEPRM